MKLCYVSTSIELGAKSRKFHTFIDSVRQFSLTSHVRNDRNDQWLHISTDAQAFANLELSATLEKFIALKCLYWNMKQCFFFLSLVIFIQFQWICARFFVVQLIRWFVCLFFHNNSNAFSRTAISLISCAFIRFMNCCCCANHLLAIHLFWSIRFNCNRTECEQDRRNGDARAP